MENKKKIGKIPYVEMGWDENGAIKEVQILYIAEVCSAETLLFLACVSLNS